MFDPNITGDFAIADMGGIEVPKGAFSQGYVHGQTVGGGQAGWDYRSWFSAARSSGIYGNTNTVQPMAIRYLCLIRF